MNVKFLNFSSWKYGGIKHLKNISAPYNHLGLKYIPLGGINESNMNDYLSENIIAAVGGSWIASRENINSNNWQQIKANAKSAILTQSEPLNEQSIQTQKSRRKRLSGNQGSDIQFNKRLVPKKL